MAGTRIIRTRVASRKIAVAIPKPSILMIVLPSLTNPRNTATMIAAAAVITVPVAVRPRATLPCGSPVRS